MSVLVGALTAGGTLAFALLVALKATVVLALALAADRALVRAPAASRHLLWAAAFAALLALPVLQAVVPAVDLAVVPATAAARPGADAAVSASRVADLGAAMPRGAVSLTAGPSAETSAAWESEAVATGGVALGAVPFDGTANRLAPAELAAGALPVAYLVGVGLFLAALGLGLVRVARVSGRARPLTADGWPALVADSARRAGLARVPRLLVSSEVPVPVVWGGLPGVRATVLLPAAARGWSAADRRNVLVHELAHLARRDWAVQLVARVACALLWFHPLVWVGLRRLVLEAERACDDRVIAGGVGSCEYADQLVALARQATSRSLVAAVAMARPHQLSDRVRALLDSGRRRGPTGRRFAGAALAVAAAAAILLAPVRPVEARAPGDGITRPSGASDPAGRSVGAWDERALDSRQADMTPLMRAAWRKDAAEARRLLDAGADPDEGVPGIGTPLILAADRGDGAMVALLLTAGADPNRAETARHRPGDLQRTPLGAAARSGDLDALRRLLDAGARVDAAPAGDATPLMTAARWGHPDLVRLLLSHGADPNVEIVGDGTPLIEAARSGHLAIVDDLLAAGAQPDTAVPGDGNPIGVAAAEGHHAVVERLLAAGAAADVFVPGDESALYHAIERGDARMVTTLLEAGADPNVRWPGEGTPLAVAVESHQAGIIPLLVSHGARPGPDAWGDSLGDADDRDDEESDDDDRADRHGESAEATFAVGGGAARPRPAADDGSQGQAAWLRLTADGRSILIPRGAVVELRGSGSLAFPDGRGTIEVPRGLSLVVDGKPAPAGAEVRGRAAALVDRSGRAAWTLRPATTADLRGPGTRITDSRVTSSRIDSDQPTVFYLAIAPDGAVTYFEPVPSPAAARRTRAAYEGDGSPLIVAARSGDLETVRLLLDRGADPNRGVEGDGSPLIAAARDGRIETVALLLDRGAEVDLVVSGDENALIQAAAAGRLEIVGLLLDRGADPNARVVANRSPQHPAGEVRTPLRMATRGGHRDVVELLLDRGAVE